jgi:hypothetical protein
MTTAADTRGRSGLIQALCSVTHRSWLGQMKFSTPQDACMSLSQIPSAGAFYGERGTWYRSSR